MADHIDMTALRLVAVALALGVAAAAVPQLWPRDERQAQAGTGDPVILAAGDVASCSSTGDEATANLLDALEGTVIVPGDLAYNSGSATEFANCYGPTWGRHKARTMPVPGNHEYLTPGASGYYNYFGAAAGDPAKGYYSFDIGSWHVLALNSNCSAIGGCFTGSPQELWLRADLRAHPAQCTLAFWHHPRFSSSDGHGSSTTYQPFWQALYDYGADVVLVGHDHDYERFAPQTPAGVADPLNGIRQFVVGTGGRGHYGFGPPVPNSEVRDSTSFGVLSMTLQPAGYDFTFIPVAGSSFTDSGSGTCHPTANDSDADGWLDAEDNCPADANNSQLNTDAVIDLPPTIGFDDATAPHSDALGDACDPDDDNDGLLDTAEAAIPCPSASAPTSPVLKDSDTDGTVDGAECALAFDPASPASEPPAIIPPDADNDGLPDAIDPNPGMQDTDADGLRDGTEVRGWATDPAAADTDGDGCTDGYEAASVNADAVVNSGDLGLVAANYTPAPYVAPLDMGKDGVINSGDLGFVASRYGACP